MLILTGLLFLLNITSVLPICNLYSKCRWFVGVLIPYAANNTEFVAKWYMDKDAPPIFSVH
jgi:hypothetical protein